MKTTSKLKTADRLVIGAGNKRICSDKLWFS